MRFESDSIGDAVGALVVAVLAVAGCALVVLGVILLYRAAL